MHRDGLYWLVCAASRGCVDNADEAQVLRVCGGSQIPCAWGEELCDDVVVQGQQGMLKWISAQPVRLRGVSGAHAEMVKALLEKGANVRAKCHAGSTCLYWACYKGYDDTAAMLQEDGAVE